MDTFECINARRSVKKFDPNHVMAEIIKLPADHDIIMAVTVGKALEAARPRGGQLPLADVVVRDRF